MTKIELKVTVNGVEKSIKYETDRILIPENVKELIESFCDAINGEV